MKKAGEAGIAVAVIDFSGTLSLEAALFARPQNLERALRESGLAALGLERRSFWSEIINPGWAEGSSGALSYQALLSRGLLRLNKSEAGTPLAEKIEAAAAYFTDAYFQQSTIDPLWAPVLHRLASQSRVIIATDHYSEATAHLTGELKSLGLAATPAAEKEQQAPILIANSADLGYRKDDLRFWELLRGRLEGAAPPQVFLVDDFGYNEQPGDSYTAAGSFTTRKKRILAAVEEAWRVPVKAFPFLLHRKSGYPALIAAADQFLSPPPAPGRSLPG